eukprot:751082-Hanusia_phi.AAC.4
MKGTLEGEEREGEGEGGEEEAEEEERERGYCGGWNESEGVLRSHYWGEMELGKSVESDLFLRSAPWSYRLLILSA